MRRNAPSDSASSEIEIRKAVETAARKSGLSPEGRLARVEAETRRLKSPEDGRRAAEELESVLDGLVQALDLPEAAAPLALKDPGRTAMALDSLADWIEQGEDRLNRAAREPAHRQDRSARSHSQAPGAIKDRGDAVEPRRAELPMPAPVPVLVEALRPLGSDASKLGHRDEPGRCSPTLDDSERELDGRQGSLDGVATRQDVAALEDHLRVLTKEAARSADREQVTFLAGAISALQSQLHQVATDLSQGLHRRIATEIDAVSAKIECVAESGVGRDVLEAIELQIGHLHGAFAEAAGQERLERLATELVVLGRRIADMQVQQVGSADIAAIGEVLDEIRASLKRSEQEAGATGIPQQLESLSRRLDVLVNRPEPRGLARLGERVGDLAEHVEALVDGSAQSAESIAARVDQRLADFAEHVDSLARVGLTSAQSLADRLDVESARITAPMRSLSEQLAELDRRLGTLATEIGKPAKLATERMTKLAGRLEALASATEPLETVGQRMEVGLAGLHEHLATLAEPVERLAARLDDSLAAVVRPVQALAARVDERLVGLSKPLRALTERVDQRLAGMDERLEALSLPAGRPTDAIAAGLSEGL